MRTLWAISTATCGQSLKSTTSNKWRRWLRLSTRNLTMIFNSSTQTTDSIKVNKKRMKKKMIHHSKLPSMSLASWWVQYFLNFSRQERLLTGLHRTIEDKLIHLSRQSRLLKWALYSWSTMKDWKKTCKNVSRRKVSAILMCWKFQNRKFLAQDSPQKKLNGIFSTSMWITLGANIIRLFQKMSKKGSIWV